MTVIVSKTRFEREASLGTEPIIVSLFDTDLYKYTMSYFAWKYHRDQVVTFALANRHADRVPIAEWVDEAELCAEIEHVTTLAVTDVEIAYLESLGLFEREYLEALRNDLELPKVTIDRRGDQYDIRVSGVWWTVTLWETIVLSIINELIGRHYDRESPGIFDMCGKFKLDGKIADLREHPSLKLTEFGTRRRRSRRWQEHVVTRLHEGLPNQLVGTSNIDLARRLGIPPIGTYAHEMPMEYAAVAAVLGDDALHASHSEFLDRWFELYGERLSIALTDPWGAEFFFSDFGEERARLWRGLRHDSGDPYMWGERAISMYESYGIDPCEKTLLWSDGLTVDSMIKIHKRFSKAVNVAFGCGTHLTNDVGHPATSIVMKLVAVGNEPTVKLTDNLAKAMGPEALVEHYAKVFGHEGRERQDVVF